MQSAVKSDAIGADEQFKSVYAARSHQAGFVLVPPRWPDCKAEQAARAGFGREIRARARAIEISAIEPALK